MKRALLFSALAIAVATPVQARESLGVFERWGAFRDAAVPRCYAIAEPAARPDRGRWRAFAAVGYWPKKSVRGQVHVRLSREWDRKSDVILSIGVRQFTLLAGGADAWAADKRMDAAIVAAIRSGTRLTVRTRGKNGAPFADVYALRGAATAIDAAALGCARL